MIDIEKRGQEWLQNKLDKSYEAYGKERMMTLSKFDGYDMLEAIEFGAKIAKEELMKGGGTRRTDNQCW